MTWRTFFPFRAGDHLMIEVRIWPLGRVAHGYGRVSMNQDNDLAFDLTVPRQATIGGQVEEMRLKCAINYRQEGGGNYARIDIDEDSIEDDNLSIISRPHANRPRRRIDPTDQPGAPDLAFTLTALGPNKAEISDIEGIRMLRSARVVVELGDAHTTDVLIADAAHGLL